MAISFDLLPLLCFSLLFSVWISIEADDTLNTVQSLRDDRNDTIVSAGEMFEFGFFSPGSSKNRYLGIWFSRIAVQTVIWVANRDIPLTDSSGELKITSQGVLVLVNHSATTIWSTNTSRPARNPVAKLLDTGNLVVKDEGGDQFLWQSFDYPTDTIIPEMKLGKNLVTGLDWHYTSWKAPDDPARGNEGDVERLLWIERTNSWLLYNKVNEDRCETYALCGAFGICDISNSPVCGCLRGFEPKSPNAANMADWSDGCVRKTKLNCFGDGFVKYSGTKLPDTRSSWYSKTMTLEECRDMCLKNCSCTAYANLDVRGGGSGCLLWFGELMDIRTLFDNKPDIYVRVAASDSDGKDDDVQISSNHNSRKRTRIIVTCALSAEMLLLALGFISCMQRRNQLNESGEGVDLGWLMARDRRGEVLIRAVEGVLSCRRNSGHALNEFRAEELPLFDLATLASATNNFSTTNKLGKGGFGPVYKGTLEDGQEIAVKRLSKDSRQGLDEFKTEVVHIVKLQHRNLVKLLGCCIESDEKMLVYEFMPNKSLDYHLFDEKQWKLLDWPLRYSIINGIARGLLYLHQDSRLRIVHRDLKASNVLLDDEMNPKISDFGLARSFGGNITEANTNKVVGTYGYISPEYAMRGVYSVKSDVFSFGVLVLETISGERNRGFCHPDHHLNLLGHAWRLFREGKALELVAEFFVDSCEIWEVIRAIHIGLLCVQELPEDRPSMSTVVLMMGGEGALPDPKQPGFFTERDIVLEPNHTANPCSISLLE
ncbi:hypothetical protein Tsubulata_025657, partial [Turnera subulata]